LEHQCEQNAQALRFQNYYAWQGFGDLFQTFEGLDDVKYINEEIKAVIKVLENGDNLLVKKFIREDD